MHYVHLGHVGLVANFHWAEILDFVLGWTTFDLEGEDAGRHAPPAAAKAGGGAPAHEQPVE
jgi:hypothetical protein